MSVKEGRGREREREEGRGREGGERGKRFSSLWPVCEKRKHHFAMQLRPRGENKKEGRARKTTEKKI